MRKKITINRCKKCVNSLVDKLLFYLYVIAVLGVLILAGFIARAIAPFPDTFDTSLFQKGWVKYADAQAGFTVTFPQEPVIEQKQLDISRRTVDYDEVRSEYTDKASYAVSSLELPRKFLIFSPTTILKGAFNALFESLPIDAKIISQVIDKHDQYRAIHFHIQQQNTQTKGRLILAGNKLYKIEFTCPRATKAMGEIETAGTAFINSLHITDQGL